jgi:hypothetical protein
MHFSGNSPRQAAQNSQDGNRATKACDIAERVTAGVIQPAEENTSRPGLPKNSGSGAE